MRGRGFVWPALAAASLLAASAAAQQAALPSPIVTLDQDRFYAESAFGKRVQADIDAATRALAAENRRIEADLEAEERALTGRRTTLAAAEFRRLADAFDEKVQGIRKARDAKVRELNQRRDVERQAFLEQAAAELASLATARGAVAILDQSAVILSFDRIDITDDAIAGIDARLGDGVTPPAPAPAADVVPRAQTAPAETPPVAPEGLAPAADPAPQTPAAMPDPAPAAPAQGN